MNNIVIQKSNIPFKKFTAIINDKKTIHFVDNRYHDITKHKDTERKKAYLARHKKDNYINLLYPSFYSTNLLWNKPTLKESIKNTNEKFNVSIKLKS